MSLRRLRSLFVFVLVAAAIAKALAELRQKATPDVSRHPTLDGGNRPPAPAADPYQGPVVEPSAVVEDLGPLSPLDDPSGGPPSTLASPKAAMGSTSADVEPIGDRTWVPSDDGVCPGGYPVKANLSSGIFHHPGQMSYDRTTPDRCYPNAQAATDDGLRAAKR